MDVATLCASECASTGAIAGAVTRFRTAVYDDSASEAVQYVCPQARDTKALAAQIDKIRAAARGYDKPGYNWTFDPGPATAAVADVTVHLSMHTDAGQVSHEDLVIRTVYARGWWVCEIPRHLAPAHPRPVRVSVHRYIENQRTSLMRFFPGLKTRDILATLSR